ncbi:GNAT family N-acetyltransferase [Halolamina sp. CBA1230]|uniref:GNAT family N-acetyltransferase n=1 Tax=Halolamina sp. CBA1230 TaxID=1853690 RepID=UPI0009A17B72|nr:GNAT family N-acetyltransferase [Halolamina sp. CBA1230]QKY19101.1 GNAT family N-acetyltransferase [Halolamina sp. CBA1230]
MALETAEEYTVRWFDPADREPFLDLYTDTFGGGSDEWFQWKYVDTPRVAHVPILVATADGEFAGARAQVPFLMRAGDETALAMRFGDTMVHPDHRRHGVFSRLTERALDHYGEMPVQFCYNVPNDLSRSGFLKAGGEIVANLPSFYRVQQPGALAAGTDLPITIAARAAAPAVRAYLRGRDQLASVPEGVNVVEHAEIPVPLLARLYRRGRPSSVHAVRDEPFLEWRYHNPDWEYRAFSAGSGGRTDAAIVTGTRTDEDGVTTTHVVDVLPLASSDRRDTALRSLLAAITSAFRDSDLLAYCGTAIPRSLLAAHGFQSDGRLPLSQVTSPTKLVAYDVGDGDWSVGGVDVADPRGWALSDVELDAR